jgi:hypothetical protein
MSSVPENSVPAHHQSFLAFDYGLKRTGVAVGNRLMKSATPQGTIAAEGDARFAHIAKRIQEWQPDALVIGVPTHPANCAVALVWRSTRWMSVTPPPRRILMAPKTPMRLLQRSFWTNF